MKTKYEFIHFVDITDKTKTSVWNCINNKSGDILGVIKWSTGWRQYCYFPVPYTLYSRECLDDVADFILQLMNERKQ